MDGALAEAHNDKLIEVITLIRSNKRALNNLILESDEIVQRLDRFQSNREVSRELRRRYIEIIENQLQRERYEYF